MWNGTWSVQGESAIAAKPSSTIVIGGLEQPQRGGSSPKLISLPDISQTSESQNQSEGRGRGVQEGQAGSAPEAFQQPKRDIRERKMQDKRGASSSTSITSTPDSPTPRSHPRPSTLSGQPPGWSFASKSNTTLKANSLPKPQPGPRHDIVPSLARSLYRSQSTVDEAEWSRRQREHFRQQQEQFRKEQQHLEDMRRKMDNDRLQRESIITILERHDRLWAGLLSVTVIHWDCIPWPLFIPPKTPEDITLSAVATYIQSPLLPDEQKNKPLKDRIITQIQKWHPDQFYRKYLYRVVETDQKMVKEGVATLLQLLNNLLSEERMNRVVGRESDMPEGQRSQGKEEVRMGQVRQKEEEIARKEEYIRQREEELVKREEEIWQTEEEVRRKMELNRRKDEEVEQKEEAVRQQEITARQKEEMLMQRDEQLKRLEEQAKLTKEVLGRSTRELQRKEDSLEAREEAVKSREIELELLITAARKCSIVTKLQSIFRDVTAKQYKRLLGCVGEEAQKILDSFQSLIDSNAYPDRGQLVEAMRRLAGKTKLYPQCYMLDGPLQLLDEHPVGAGRFADIYRATFRGQTTCLKVIRAHEPGLVKHMAKIYAREAIIWGQLSHPNLLPFYGLHTYRSQIAFVAPYALGGNLKEYLAKEPRANRVLLCVDTAAGVRYLHANKVVHGDLKAVNVLVDASGRGCLADFGVSGVTDQEIIQWTTQSAAASKGGSTRWQAPELHDPDAQDTVHNTTESDVFAWASTSYEIFTGTIPFANITSDTKVALMIHRGVLPTRPRDDDPSWSEHGLTEEIWKLFQGCWRNAPANRPTMSDILSRLEKAKPDDTRPPAQWAGEFSKQFRTAPEAGLPPSMADLDITLSRILGDYVFEDVDDL